MEFQCAICEKTAGKVYLRSSDISEIVRESFTSLLTFPIKDESKESVSGWIESGDIKNLFEFDAEVGSFYCPACNACYCQDHWNSRDIFDEEGFHDSIRGVCPQGHERMLED